MDTAAHTTASRPRTSDSERFKRQIYEEWQSPAIVAAYRKWGEHESAWGSVAREVIIERARVQPGMTVLDLASGHGEPSLALARAVGPTGHVTATDQGPGLLDIARDRAQGLGLGNITFRVADAHELPFPDGTFDRVTCRLGVMYFADYPQALREAYRVLVPGGRATYLAWGPREQPLFDILVGILLKYVEPPPSEPGAPAPFAFAEPGSLSAALKEAGFSEIEEEQLTIPSPFPGTPEQYWEWWVDMTPPFRPLIDSLTREERQRVIDEVLTALLQYYDGEHVDIPIQVVVASGVR